MVQNKINQPKKKTRKKHLPIPKKIKLKTKLKMIKKKILKKWKRQRKQTKKTQNNFKLLKNNLRKPKLLNKQPSKQSTISTSLTMVARWTPSSLKAKLKRRTELKKLMKIKRKMSRKSSKSRNCRRVT